MPAVNLQDKVCQDEEGAGGDSRQGPLPEDGELGIQPLLEGLF